MLSNRTYSLIRGGNHQNFMQKLSTAKLNSGKGSGTKGSFEGEPIDVSTLNIPMQLKVKGKHQMFEEGFGDKASKTPTIPKRYATRNDPLIKHPIVDITIDPIKDLGEKILQELRENHKPGGAHKSKVNQAPTPIGKMPNRFHEPS